MSRPKGSKNKSKETDTAGTSILEKIAEPVNNMVIAKLKHDQLGGEKALRDAAGKAAKQVEPHPKEPKSLSDILGGRNKLDRTYKHPKS